MFDLKKVDAAIERIADRICKNNTGCSFEEMQIDVQMTTALAELTKARAELDHSEKNEIIEEFAKQLNNQMSKRSVRPQNPHKENQQIWHQA